MTAQVETGRRCLTWAVGGLAGAAVGAAAASAAGEGALDGRDKEQNQQAAGPGEAAHWSHDGGRREMDGGKR